MWLKIKKNSEMIWSEYVESESNVHVVYCNNWTRQCLVFNQFKYSSHDKTLIKLNHINTKNIIGLEFNKGSWIAYILEMCSISFIWFMQCTHIYYLLKKSFFSDVQAYKLEWQGHFIGVKIDF